MEIFNAADFLVHRHIRAGAGEKVALIGSERELTYEQLAEELARVASGLRGLGLNSDDRVVLVMADNVDMAVAILAVFHAGLVAVPVSTMFNSRELGTVLRDCGARVVIASAEFLDTTVLAATAAPELTHLVVVDAELPATAGAVTVTRWSELDGPIEQPTPTSADSWALWLYTSGTTGTPKAAMHRHANIRHVYETYGVQTLGIEPSDICLSVAKMFFAYGIGNSLFFPLAAGATTVLQPLRPTPASMAERLTATSPTLFFGVPTFYAGLLAADFAAETFRSVRLCVSAGEILPESLQRKFQDRFGVEILDGIGSTEALHIFLSNRPGDIRPGSTGKPVPGYTLEIRDLDGLPADPGTPGDLYVSGESIALGYWHQTEASRTVFQGKWLRTGDTYVVDEQGYYHCLGRTNDLIKAGGIWVSPGEVEERLRTHSAVAEAAVVGIPDKDGLDKPVALVVPAPGHEDITPEALIGWCRDGLAHFKSPRSVVFASELPKTATGKIQRFRVKEQLLQGSEATR
ncbi:benzoate-CoA ligase family protein [Nocardia vinacea]|uniref:benzoate-CoA ligase family protein n=1 Tax=Nocardia vinacea TaxID=96468 RepID=UPI0003101B2F|nr:benzoate-CoA ligase family protein [Nocardia vinacea]